MNENYKKLMAQHGGYIPFTVLGKTNSSIKRSKKTKRAKKTVRNKSSFMFNASKYSPGTMIRSNGILYHLNNSRQWTKI